MRNEFQDFRNPHSETVSKGTLRRLFRQYNKPLFGLKQEEDGTMKPVVLDNKTLDIFKGFRKADTFKVWVKLNIRQLLRYYKEAPGFTHPAAALLEI
jgi:hypothetical protein